MCWTGGLSSRCDELFCKRSAREPWHSYRRHLLLHNDWISLRKTRLSLPFTLRVFPCKFWQALLYLSKYLTLLLNHFDESKNLLELPHPTRNIRKCSIKLMTNTSHEINLQSKQDIICHVPKVKPETSAHYGADVIPVLAYLIFPLNPTLR